SDIFALGIVLYELTTGQHPFIAASELGVLHAIVAADPVRAARLNPEIPAALDELIQRMLAKGPHLRPSAAEVDAVLTEVAGKTTVLPPSRLATLGRPTVGRDAEIAALRAGFESAAQGRGLMFCVAGEAGLGKTTLVEDFLDELTAAGSLHSRARGRCSER